MNMHAYPDLYNALFTIFVLRTLYAESSVYASVWFRSR